MPKHLKKIPAKAFRGCYTLENLVLPEGYESIGDSAFYGCDKLSGIRLPSNLKEIPKGLFYFCGSLKSIEIPDGVERIEEEAFAYAGLERIHLPKNLKYIGPFAFRDLHKLEELILPASLETIEGGAFVCLTSLNRIYCLAATPPKCNTIGYAVGEGYNKYYYTTGAFGWMRWSYNQDYTDDNTPYDIPVYVPKGSADLYSATTTTGWQYFRKKNFIETDEFPEL